MSNIDLTDSEKIDYIYRKLRAKARIDAVMLFIKLAILGFIIYFYMYIVPKMDIEGLINKYAIPYMSKIVQMTADKAMNSVWNNIGNIDLNSINNALNNSNSSITTTGTTWVQRRRNVPNNTNKSVNITPEMIDAVKNSMNK